jgi:hypothetical protein
MHMTTVVPTARAAMIEMAQLFRAVLDGAPTPHRRPTPESSPK